MSKIYPILLLAAVIWLGGCSKKDTTTPSSSSNTNTNTGGTQEKPGINQVTFINGSCGFNNNTYTINPIAANYYLNSGATSISQSLVHNGISVEMSYPIAGTGNYTFNGYHTNNSLFILVEDSTDFSTLCVDEFESESVNINVTKYEAVDGLIEGTWSGTFKSLFNKPELSASGKFSLLRGSDL